MSLNLKEKASVAESSIIMYYKQCVIEWEKKNHILEQEVELLKRLNMSYYSDNNAKEALI